MDVSLDRLVVDPGLQPRVGGLDPDHVRALEEAPASWPPLAAVQRDGRLVLVDGFHRLAAAQNLGLATVPVRVVDEPADGDLHVLAFALNAAHGRPLSLADRRAFAERLLRGRPEVSNMEVSRLAGLSPTTVAALRARLEEATAIRPTPERVGADGARYPAGAAYRPAGDLPDPGLGDLVGDAVGRLFTPAERREQRRVARYLERLAVALEDQDGRAGWASAAVAAEACRLVLGAERAAELGERLGWTARNVLDVAVALGYDDAESDA